MNMSSTTGFRPVAAAPTAAPTKAASEIGVSRMRSAPNSSYRPRVTAKMPPASATSIPIRQTVGSTRISAAIPSRIASMYRSAGVSVAVDIAQDLCELGERRRAGELFGARNAGFGVAHDRVELVVGGEALRCDLRARDEQRVTSSPGLCLLGRLVPLRVSLVVALPAIGPGFDQPWTFACTAGIDGLLGRAEHSPDVVAVDDRGPYAVRRSESGDAFTSRHRATVRELRVAVVLADEQHRQIPHRSKVDRLVEGALVHGSLAEEGHGHAVTAEHAAREGRARRERQACSDDRVRAGNAFAPVGDVHRATPALAPSRSPAEE